MAWKDYQKASVFCCRATLIVVHWFGGSCVVSAVYQDSPVVSRKAKKQHARAAYATTGVLFTATNAVKFAIAVTRSS